ncbi:hypothetical protein B0J17DRAFT_767705 [Rhizoctonia solani]|nr:hypothetical protein B0J17DRAFT_767705 [Rhizoctonia solani]
MSPPFKPPNRTSFALRDIAILAQTLPQKLHILRIKSENPSRKLSGVYGERHKQIFPGGFDSTSPSSSTQRPHYSFSPERLYDVLTSGYTPEHHVEHIIVKWASYCKKISAPKHEFILLEVEDKKAPGLKNFIVLDRNNGEVSHRQTRLGYQSSQSFIAKDEFRVSYDGDRARLFAQCNLQDHATLETLVFKPDDPLLLYQLATLTRAVSLQRDKYRVITYNCYWFAGLIWDCMLRMHPFAYHKVAQGQIRGAFISWLRQSINTAELDVTYEFVDKELLEIEKIFTIQKQRWVYTYDNQLKDDLEAMTKRVRDLENQLNGSSDSLRH